VMPQLNAFQRALIEKARTTVRPVCKFCGESHGGLIDGAHALCREFYMQGLPIPHWKRCEECAGLGRIPISAVGPVNPSGKTMERWAPACDACGGKGF
jgi:hypothetical protein